MISVHVVDDGTGQDRKLQYEYCIIGGMDADKHKLEGDTILLVDNSREGRSFAGVIVSRIIRGFHRLYGWDATKFIVFETLGQIKKGKDDDSDGETVELIVVDIPKK